MTDPREHGVDPELDADAELVKDLDVDDDGVDDIAGGASSGVAASRGPGASRLA